MWLDHASTSLNSRNHINILSSDAVVALPGGPGTLSEVKLALVYGRPCMAFLGASGTIDGKGTESDLGVPVGRTVDEVEAFLAQSVPRQML